ncbi:putative Ig domain-containing protein [Shewanella sp. HL-SH8]|uniref:putative Ig domain-containing protein n=1 Tax=Shewanella sp. HL-SH8 TaxID=3436242 RepID=UPI003EBE0BF5
MDATFIKMGIVRFFGILIFAILAYIPAFTAIAVPVGFTATGQFNSATIGSGNISSLTLTLNNGTGQSISGVGFVATIDDLAILNFATPNNISTSCSGGSYSFTTTDFTAVDYLMTDGESCSFTFDVKGVTVSDTTISGVTVTGLISSAGPGTNPPDSILLTVDINSISASLTAAESELSVGSINRMTLNLSNLPVYFTGFYRMPSGTIFLPDGVLLASPVNFSTTCGALTNNNASGSQTFALPTGPADVFECELSFDVKAESAGVKNFYSGLLTNTANNQPIGKVSASYESKIGFITSVFSPINLAPGGTGSIDVTILNTDRTNDATNIAFTNDLNAALTGLVSTGDLADVCGSGSALTGTGLLSFTGGSLAAGSSCQFSIAIAVPSNATPGTYTNTTSAISYDLDGSSVTPSNALSSFNVNSAPTLSIDTKQSGVQVSAVAAGEVFSVEYTLTNIDANNAASAISFSHVLDNLSGFTATLPANDFCGTGSVANFTATTTNAPPFVAFTGLSLTAGDNCVFSVDYTVPATFSAGNYLLSVGSITASINAISVQSESPSASKIFGINTAPSLLMSFSPAVTTPGGSSTIDFEIRHSDGSTYGATDIGFSVALDSILSGLTVQSLPTDPCGVGSTIVGTTDLILSSALLGIGESCEFSVPVTIPANTVSATYSFITSVLSASINSATLTSPTVSTDLQITNFSASKSFTPVSLKVGTGTTLKSTYVLNNADPVNTVSAIQFNENFANLYSGVTVTSVTQADACGTGSSATIAGTSLFLISGELTPSTSCTFEVSLLLPANMPANVYSNVTSAITATVGGNNVSFAALTANLTVDQLSTLTSIDVSSPTSESTVLMSIAFSDDVLGFDISDIVATNATLSNFVPITARTFSVEVMPTTDGEVTLNVGTNAAQDAVDITIESTAAVPIRFVYQTTPLAPTPSLTISSPSLFLTSSNAVTFDIGYTDVETVNLTETAISLNKTGDANATVTVLNGGTSSAVVSLSGFTGNGSLGINIAADTARFSTNLAPAAGPSTVFVVDTKKPIVTLSTLAADQTSDFTLTIVFDENVSGFDIGDISVINGSLSNFQTIDAKNYTVLVSASGETTVALSILDSASTDAAGNGNTASNTLNINYDDLLPSVSISGPSGTVIAGFSATINFSEVVSGFDVSDIQTTNANLSSFTNINGMQYTVDVNPIAQSSVGLAINAGVATDALGNANTSAVNYAVIYDFNDAPVIGGAPATSVDEDSAYSFIPTASDDDSTDTLSFSIINKPTWATFNSANGSLTGTPTNGDVGTTAGIVIGVSDSTVTTNLAAFSITVVNTNDAPVITGSPVTSVDEDSAYNYTLVVSDADVGDILTYSAVTKPDWLSFNIATGVLNGTPTNAEVGSHAVTLKATDTAGLTAEQSFSISVNNVNDAPVISSTVITAATQDAAYSYTLVASDADVGDTLTYAAVTKPDWLSFNIATGLLNGTPTNAEVGSHAVTLKVTDTAGLTAEQSFNISVNNVNDAPVISSTAITAATQDAVYSYTLVASDADVGDILTYSAVTKPDWLSFNIATGLLNGTPTNAEVGSHAVTLKVTDTAGLTAEQSFSISVNNVNDAPVISSTAITAASQDAAYSYTLVASDADVGDTLTYAAVTKPDWLSFNIATGLLNGTPTNAEVGSHAVTLKVTDTAGLTAEQSFSISVNNVNDAPVISSTAITAATQDAAYSYTLVASDADVGDTLTYAAVTKPDWLSFNIATGELNGTPTNAEVGSHAVTLKVTDTAGLTAEQSFSISVENINDAPEISGSPLLSIDQDESYIFTPVVVDADDLDVLSFMVANKPAWAQFNITDGTLSGIPTNADVGVTSDIMISVSDGTIQVDLPVFNIEVVNVNDAPTFESDPVLETSVLAPYQYDVLVSDIDVDASLTLIIVTAPEWLSLNSLNQLVGTPPVEAADTNVSIVLSVTDGIIDTPIQQSFELNITQPTDTELDVTFYFSPAPAIVGQKVNLVIDVVNTGYTAAIGLKYHITFASELSLDALPSECIETKVGVLDCVITQELAIGQKLTRIVGLTVGNVDSGFSSAEITVSGDNLSDAIFSNQTTILLANSLSILPGKVLISVPSSLGYAVDMNDDMFSDLLVYLPNEMAIQVMLNDGLGQLIPDVKIMLSGTITSLTATDINLDGNVDILTTGGATASNRVYLLDDQFDITATEFLDDVKADIILIADFDSDGNYEVVLAGIYQPEVAIYSGVGSGATSVTLLPIAVSLPLVERRKTCPTDFLCS